MEFMRKLWAWMTRFKGQNINKEIMYMTHLILILSSSKLSSNRWLIPKHSQLNSKTFLKSILNSFLNWMWFLNSSVMVHDMKDLVMTTYNHKYILLTSYSLAWVLKQDTWIVEDSSKELEETFSKWSKELSRRNS